MIVSIDSNEYFVKFFHKMKGVFQGTYCRIFKNGEQVGIGVARKSPEDQFNRKVGRKLALARALGSFSKAERALFWNKYFEVCKK